MRSDGLHTEIHLTGAACANDLVPVRRNVQIQRENLALRQAMLQPHRQHRLLELRRAVRDAAAACRAPIEQDLRGLLRDRRATFNDRAGANVADDRADEGQRIDAWMTEEAVVLGGDRGVDQRRRKVRGIETRRASSRVRSGFVERRAVPVHHHGRRIRRSPPADPPGLVRGGSMPRRRVSPPQRPRGKTASRCRGSREAGDHHRTSIVAVAVRPNTSGSYISSACVGAVRNVPVVVARAM